MDKNEIKNRITALIQEQIGTQDEPITDDTKFADDLGYDSLDVTELAIKVEQEFDINISDSELYENKTVGQLVDCVVNHL